MAAQGVRIRSFMTFDTPRFVLLRLVQLLLQLHPLETASNIVLKVAQFGSAGLATIPPSILDL